MELTRRRTAYLSVVFLVLVVAVELWVFSLESVRRIRALRLHVYVILNMLGFLCVWFVWKRANQLLRSKSLLSASSLMRLSLLILLGLAQCGVLAFKFPVSTEPHILSTVGSVCTGIVIFLTTSLISVDICSFIVRKTCCRRRRGSSESTDRTEMKIRTLLALFCALVLTCSGLIGMARFTVERIQIPIQGLDPKLSGTTIVQLTDIHLGPFSGRTLLLKILKEVNKLNADFVMITGDLVDSSVENLREAVQPLATIKSKHGVYYSTGNHDYYTGDVDNWIIELPKLNVTPLINRRVCLLARDPSSCDGGFYLAGLEDIETRRLHYGAHSMDLHTALSGRRKGIPTIVLAHQPWAAAEAIMWNDVRLVLSGHTHAGQILPWMLFVWAYNPYFVGLYEPRPGVFVYVSPGSLYYHLPFRHYRAEVTHITLVSG